MSPWIKTTKPPKNKPKTRYRYHGKARYTQYLGTDNKWHRYGPRETRPNPNTPYSHTIRPESAKVVSYWDYYSSRQNSFVQWSPGLKYIYSPKNPNYRQLWRIKDGRRDELLKTEIYQNGKWIDITNRPDSG